MLLKNLMLKLKSTLFILILIINIFVVFNLFSSDAKAVDGENHFQFISRQCKPDENEAVESVPQSPPLVIDDPSTPGCNNWEINVLVDADLTHSDQSWELPLFDVNYGFGDNIELTFEAPNSKTYSAESSPSGFTHSKTGIKIEFYENPDTSEEMAFYPQVDFTVLSSNPQQNLDQPTGSIYSLPFLYSRKVGENSHGDVSLNANIGYNISTRSDTQDSLSAELALGAPLSNHLALMAELTTEQAVVSDNQGTRDQQTGFNVGIMHKAFKWLLWYGSVGKSLYSSDQKDHTFVVTGIRL